MQGIVKIVGLMAVMTLSLVMNKAIGLAGPLAVIACLTWAILWEVCELNRRK